MRAGSLRRSTAVFAVLLVLGGVIRRVMPAFGPAADSAFTVLRAALYAGMLLEWLSSVRNRLLPTPARTYILASGGLLLLLLLAQNVRFRPALENPAIYHWCWYIYYIPMIMVPALFAMSCLHMSRGIPGRTDLVPLVPSAALVAAVLTNDLHYRVFIPAGSAAAMNGEAGSYTYGFGYYVICVWVSLCLAAGLLETCIRTRLIPSNGNYRGFFAHMETPAVITDRGMEKLYATAAPLGAGREQMAAALEGPVELSEGLRLHGKAVSAGNVFWAEDEGTLNRLRQELEDANETIEMENDLLRYENEQKEERARVDARNRLYERAAREVYPAQKRLEALIDQAQPGTDGFRGKMAEICVLNAYIKRRANFVLLSEERSGITAAEMRAALSESAVYLGYCGTAATVDCEAEKDIPFTTAAAVLDTYEAAAEALLGRASYLWIRLRDGELKMIADCAELPETGETPLAAEPGEEDGSACWTIRWEGGAA